MIKLFNDNFDLYKSSKEFYQKSLEVAKILSNNDSNKKIIFHCIWRVPREFGRKQAAVLKSIIVHHFHNEFEINLWSNIDLSNNEFLKDILQYINIKRWNFDEEKIGTILENYQHLNNNTINDSLCYIESDIFRLMVLYKYGGFYIDMDVLILRNMSPLNKYEFLYQWGTSGNNNEKFSMNNAIMRFDKESLLSTEYLEILCKTPIQLNTTAFGNVLYSKIEKNIVLVLPGIWFNSEWGFEDTNLEPFKKIDNINFFDGAFTWHWHNRWDEYIEDGSKFQILEEKHNQMFIELNSK
jgi:hypothetical protein